MEFRVRNIFVLRSATLSLVLAPFSAYFGGKLQGVLSSGQAIGSTWIMLSMFFINSLYSLLFSMLSNPLLLVSLADDPSKYTKYTHSQSFTIIHTCIDMPVVKVFGRQEGAQHKQQTQQRDLILPRGKCRTSSEPTRGFSPVSLKFGNVHNVQSNTAGLDRSQAACMM